MINTSKTSIEIRKLALLFLTILVLIPSQVLAQSGGIVMDGNFGDWAGQPCVEDPEGDAKNNKTDIRRFCFSNNPDDETAYFMAERWGGGNTKVTYRLIIDANDNGNYSESQDRMVVIDYDPGNNDSNVTVTLYDGTGAYLTTIANGADWGESKSEGGLRVEWYVSFSDLGIAPYQVIDMYLETYLGGIADGSDEVQWTPANALGWPLLIGLLLAGVVWLWRKRRNLRTG